MEKQASASIIFCPVHVTQAVQKLDPRPEAIQHFYCSDCILEYEDPKSLAKSLLSLSDFLRNASLFYLNQPQKTDAKSEIPPEYSEILASKGENLEKLSKHITEQKKLIQNVFEEITEVILEQIKQKKNSYLQMLDDQILDLTNYYHSFEKELKKKFPRSEDLESLYPSRTELEQRLSKITTYAQLTTFVKEIKYDVQQGNGESENDNQTQQNLDAVFKGLIQATSIQPRFETKQLTLQDLSAPFKQNLDDFLRKSLLLKDQLSQELPLPSVAIDSNIIGSKEVAQLRQWLAGKYQFTPNLLYRGSRDGFTPNDFHSRCDDKGPTLTLIKCKFQGVSTPSIIGGFLDKDWHKKNSPIESKEAFIFSLTTNVKLTVSDPTWAAFGSSRNGPTFGQEYAISTLHSNGCYVKADKSYQDEGIRIIDNDVCQKGRIPFNLEEMEIYNLK